MEAAMTRTYDLFDTTGAVTGSAVDAATAAAALGVTVEELLKWTYHPFSRFATAGGIVVPNAGAAE
jgi:hypothetical protein